MRKSVLFLFMLIVAAALVVTGCNNTPSATSTTNATAPVSSTNAPANTNTSAQATTTAAAPPASSAPASTTPAAAQARDGGVLRIIGTEAPQGSIGIPENMRGLGSSQCIPFIETLIRMNAAGQITWVLVENADWSSDNKTVTLHLRHGVKFHDGSDWNSQALMWNLQQRINAKVDGTENIAGTTVVDDYTFQITIKNFQNTWFGKLGQTMGYIISPKSLDQGIDYANWHPIGTGPFKFVSYKENDNMVMERFNGYWGPKPHLDGIKYIFIADPVTAQIAFQSGQGDVISVMAGGPKLATDMKKLGFLIDATAGGLCMAFIPSVTTSTSPLANVKVRQAIEMAIDKAKIAQTVGLGYFTPLYQYAGSTQAPFDPNFKGRTYDVAAAKQLLAEAGFPNGLKITLYAGQHLAGDEMPLVQANLKAINVDSEIQLVSVAKWIDMETNGWPDGILESPTSLMTDYGTTVLRYLIKPASPNWSRGIYWNSMYRPDQLETLCQQYLVTPDVAGQAAKGKEIIKLIYDQAIAIPLWDSMSIAVTTNKVHDRTAPGQGVPYWNLTGCWLSE